MPIEIRSVESGQMRKNIKVVKKMTGKMSFDENMGKVHWSLVRRISNFGYRFMPKEKGVKFRKMRLGDIKAITSVPDNLESENIILYIHGGGFVSGGAISSKGYCSMLAKFSGCKVIAVDYRLAPENPYPKGADDCFNAYSEILKQYPQAKIALVGESAGANLCLVTSLRVADNNLKKPSCIVVHSPFVDFCGTLDRTQHEVDDFTVKEGCLKPLNDIYVTIYDAKSPYISPLYGNFNAFPPLFITCDYNETLFADSIAIYNKCEQSGTEVKMIQMKGAFHVFATIGTGAPETQKILIENCEFIKNYFKN